RSQNRLAFGRAIPAFSAPPHLAVLRVPRCRRFRPVQPVHRCCLSMAGTVRNVDGKWLLVGYDEWKQSRAASRSLLFVGVTATAQRAGRSRAARDLMPRPEPEFAEDVFEVHFGGALGDRESLGAQGTRERMNVPRRCARPCAGPTCSKEYILR